MSKQYPFVPQLEKLVVGQLNSEIQEDNSAWGDVAKLKLRLSELESELMKVQAKNALILEPSGATFVPFSYQHEVVEPLFFDYSPPAYLHAAYNY